MDGGADRRRLQLDGVQHSQRPVRRGEDRPIGDVVVRPPVEDLLDHGVLPVPAVVRRSRSPPATRGLFPDLRHPRLPRHPLAGRGEELPRDLRWGDGRDREREDRLGVAPGREALGPDQTEDQDAEDTQAIVEAAGRKCLLIKGDVKDSNFCKEAVKKVVDQFGKINILVNNAGMQFPQKDVKNITDEQLRITFQTNIFAYFYFAEAVLEHMHEGDCIINTTSVTAYRSSPSLIDYSSTKGAITTFTRSLATNLAEKKIRVNGVAPGPVWTPLIVSTFDEEKIKKFGSETAMKRAGQPSELGPAYVFLASDDASFITGQVIHVNGGEVVNG